MTNLSSLLPLNTLLCWLWTPLIHRKLMALVVLTADCIVEGCVYSHVKNNRHMDMPNINNNNRP